MATVCGATSEFSWQKEDVDTMNIAYEAIIFEANANVM
jgi:hypothetical protein